VDQIIDITKIKITTEKRVKSNEPFFKGHYPGNPIMPGVLVCEAIFQSGAVLVSSTYKNSGTSAIDSKGVPVLTRIKDVKFKNIVRPNDLLQIQVELAERIGGAFFMKGVAMVDGKVAVRVEFAVTIANVD
jgi:3-hydroxyacyl-[acyl-carrier-protein] dehydratase|tara:strand:- start:4080 stop:4472 length:393 start_codon:yes stop_codon:yes gene_type:complete